MSQQIRISKNQSENNPNVLTNPLIDSTLAVLKTALADSYIQAFRVKDLHWNVTGLNFMELHLFLDDEYEALLDVGDRIAERIRAFDVVSQGTLASFLNNGTLRETEYSTFDTKIVLQSILDGYQSIANYLRVNLPNCDSVTQNFFQDIIYTTEKTMWKVRSFLK